MTPYNNPYAQEIDFASLALQDADFAKILKSNGQLDFSNPEAVQQLTKSLLKRDFGLKLELPDDRLCPPVPNRLNYLLWIQRLLDGTSENYSERFDAEREVLGLDIGTGASCIYPLLGCAQRPKWRFAGTDIDEKSLQFARSNVEGNGLQGRIKVLKTQKEGPLIPLDKLGVENINFTMCNPPFYTSKDDLISSAACKQRPAFTACTGSETEMVTEGGEVAFVSKMIEESVHLQDRMQWYTSMLGKFSSVELVINKLKEKGIDNYAATEFVQGGKTRRWGVAWSFEDLRPRMAVARNFHSLPKALLPFPSEYTIVLKEQDVSTTTHALNNTLSALPLKWIWKASLNTGLGFSEKAVWSRAARRQQKSPNAEEESDDMALGFKIQISSEENDTRIVIWWIKGHDSVLFESFCGMVKRKLEE